VIFSPIGVMNFSHSVRRFAWGFHPLAWVFRIFTLVFRLFAQVFAQVFRLSTQAFRLFGWVLRLAGAGDAVPAVYLHADAVFGMDGQTAGEANGSGSRERHSLIGRNKLFKFIDQVD
jgi:hypothetical protein